MVLETNIVHLLMWIMILFLILAPLEDITGKAQIVINLIQKFTLEEKSEREREITIVMAFLVLMKKERVYKKNYVEIAQD